MAKVGEGDPRWIVQEKEDGRNVNSWHWEEKDITGWAKDHLKKLLQQKFYTENDLTLEFVKVDKAEGDVVINVRKGKLIYVYDLEVTMKFEADITGDKPTRVKGTLEFNFNVEDHEDFQITSQFDGTLEPAIENRVKPLIRSKGFDFVRKQVLQFVTDVPVLNPYAGKSPSASKPAAKPAAAPAAAAPTPMAVSPTATPAPTPAPTSAPAAAKPKGKTLTMTVEVPAPPQEVYNTLLDQGKLSAITQSAVTMSREVGASFSMFGGSVTGEISSLNPPHQIVQKWRSSSWPAGHFSLCTFALAADGSHATKLVLTQEGIPGDDFDRTQHGWRALFFDRMRLLFGHVSFGDS